MFRPMALEDIGMISQWRSSPEVGRWYHSEAADGREKWEKSYRQELEEKPRLTWHFIILLGGEAAGFVQTYLLKSYPEVGEPLGASDSAAMVDIILAPGFMHKGYGSHVMKAFLRDCVFSGKLFFADVCLIGPNPGNVSAIRMYEKAGFCHVKTVFVPCDDDYMYVMKIGVKDLKAYETLKRQEIFDGKIFQVFVDEISLPNGGTAAREIVLLHREGVGILPVDEDGGIFLVRQYRHPLDDFVLEIPAGLMEAGEEPAKCAARELEEEIGYRAGRLDFALAANNAVGVTNDKIHIFIGRDLVRTAQNLDEDEFLSVEKYSLEECRKMIFKKKIIDSKTILAIFAYMLEYRN